MLKAQVIYVLPCVLRRIRDIMGLGPHTLLLKKSKKTISKTKLIAGLDDGKVGKDGLKRRLQGKVGMVCWNGRLEWKDGDAGWKGRLEWKVGMEGWK